jgi:hypothetical protein
LETAFRALADATLSDLLSFLEPKRISDDARALIHEKRRIGVRPPHPTTVAYHFHVDGTERKFDRDKLVTEMLDRACRQVEETARESAATYIRAAESIAETGSVESIYQALEDDHERYSPGSAAEPVDARERLYLAAIALSDQGTDIANKLRAARTASDETFVNVYEKFLDMTGRRLVDGYTTRDLAVLISMLLNGESMRSRFRDSLPMETVAGAVVRMFWAFTIPADASAPDVEAELIAGITARLENRGGG